MYTGLSLSLSIGRLLLANTRINSLRTHLDRPRDNSTACDVIRRNIGRRDSHTSTVLLVT